jgi:hypothetical protein
LLPYLAILAIGAVLAINVAERVRPVVLDNFAAVNAAFDFANRR